MMEIRAVYRRQLREIQDEILVMGSMVEKALASSIGALKSRDIETAKRIIADDEKVNRNRFEIEERCIQLIATQQPLAGDLRIIIAVLNIIVELERIGDYAVGIARIVVLTGDEPPIKPLIDIPRMTDKAILMLRESLQAFIARDAQAARATAARDDEVDTLYIQVYRELLTFMTEDPRTITRASRLMQVAHNLERSADRVTNICERVEYAVTGKMQETRMKGR
ncbi:MAG TPA: phosphate signaling complex protein PhoU [Anaerolineae bacterium]|nr:phosphate signaling complex protein PhoU [Anaerolineae bacterium]